MLAACGQQEYRFLECGTWKTLYELRREPIQVTPGPLAFQPSGNLIAVIRSPSEVLLVDGRTFEPHATLRSPAPVSITDLCFDTDGRHLAVGTSLHGVLWWDLVTLRAELARLGLDWKD
jgi:hypothetical protein